jgi:hypothetical protein
MRYMLFIYPGESYEGQTEPSVEDVTAMQKFNEDLTKAGVLLSLDGLHPASEGARVKFSGGGSSTVTDGPFTEAKELISYAVYELRSREEAVEWASRFLTLHRDLWPGWEGDAEIRRVFGPEDFG